MQPSLDHQTVSVAERLLVRVVRLQQDVTTCRRQRDRSQHEVVGEQMAAVSPEVVDASGDCCPRRCQLFGASHPVWAASDADCLMPTCTGEKAQRLYVSTTSADKAGSEGLPARLLEADPAKWLRRAELQALQACTLALLTQSSATERACAFCLNCKHV